MTETALQVPGGSYPLSEIFAVEAQAPTLGTGALWVGAALALSAVFALLSVGALRSALALALAAAAIAPWVWAGRRYSLVIRTKAGWVRALHTDDYQLVVALAGQLEGRLSSRARRR